MYKETDFRGALKRAFKVLVEKSQKVSDTQHYRCEEEERTLSLGSDFLRGGV